jgi:hypothetical protein
LGFIQQGALHEGAEQDRVVIEVVGTFLAPDPLELDMWGGRMKFVFKDNVAQGEEEQRARELLALQVPGLASLATSKALLTVFRQVGQEGEEGAWQEVTVAFAAKVQAYGFA